MQSRSIKQTFAKALQFFAAILVIAIPLASVLNVGSAHAQVSATARFEDRAHIRLTSFSLPNGEAELSAQAKEFGEANIRAWITHQIIEPGIFFDNDISNGAFIYDFQTCGSTATLTAVSLEGVDKGEFQLRDIMIKPEGIGGTTVGCFAPFEHNALADWFGNFYIPVNANNRTNSDVWFNTVDDKTLIRVDGRDGNYVSDTNDTRRYNATGDLGSTCPGTVTNKPYVVGGPFNADGYTGAFYDSCDNVGKRDIRVRGKNITPANIAPPGSGATGTAGPTCESSGGSLSWFICPILTGIDGAIRKIDESIQSLLAIDPAFLSNQGLHDAWARLRNLAYLILVPIMLVMVIGTAMGFEFFSAYTIKRALPRFVVAVIFIALSWQIVVFLVQLTNAIGAAVAGLITSTVANAGEVKLADIFSPSTGDTWKVGGLAALSVGAGALAGIAGAITWPILLSYGITIILAILVGFLILTFRQMAIIFLMLFAPLAILAWIFPGNDKLWNFWRKSFVDMLLLYPAVVALIAVGKVFTVIIGGIFSGLVLVIAVFSTWVAVYAAIPVIVTRMGGIVATATGMVNNKTKGLFDRSKNYRGQARAAGWQRFTTGEGHGAVRRAGWARRMGQGAGVGWQGRFGIGERGRSAVSLAAATNERQTMENNPWMAQLANNDDANAVMALSGGRVRGARQARDQLALRWTQAAIQNQTHALGRQLTDDEVAAITADNTNRADAAYNAASAVGFTEAKAQAALTSMAQNKSRAINAGDFDVVQEGINRLSGGNAARTRSLAYSYQYNSRGAGRYDLGGDWMANNTRDSAIMDGLGRSGMMEFVSRGHTNQVRQAADTLQRELGAQVDMNQINNIQDPGQRTEALRMQTAAVNRRREVAAQRVMEMQHNLSYATGDNQNVINQMMNNLGLDASQPLENQLAERLQPPGSTDAEVSVISQRLRSQARIHDNPQLADEQHQQDIAT